MPIINNNSIIIFNILIDFNEIVPLVISFTPFISKNYLYDNFNQSNIERVIPIYNKRNYLNERSGIRY